MRLNTFLAKARAAGLAFSEQAHMTRITGHFDDEGFPIAIVVWSDGTIYRADIDQSMTKRMTITEAAKVLGLSLSTQKGI